VYFFLWFYHHLVSWERNFTKNGCFLLDFSSDITRDFHEVKTCVVVMVYSKKFTKGRRPTEHVASIENRFATLRRLWYSASKNKCPTKEMDRHPPEANSHTQKSVK
jgi:hypothetical protein